MQPKEKPNWSSRTTYILWKPPKPTKVNTYNLIVISLDTSEGLMNYERHLTTCGFRYPYSTPIALRPSTPGDPWHRYRLAKWNYSSWKGLIEDEWRISEDETWCKRLIGLQMHHQSGETVTWEDLKNLCNEIEADSDIPVKQLQLF